MSKVDTKMAIYFELNDRDNSNLLSDRIIDSADNIFQKHLSEDYVQKCLMYGERNATNIGAAHRRHKDALFQGTDGAIVTAFNNLIEHAEKECDKQALENINLGFKGLADVNIKRFEAEFGKHDQSVVDAPLSQWMYSLVMSMNYESSKGFLRGLCSIIPGFICLYRSCDYVVNHPNYKPNPFPRILCYQDMDLYSVVKLLRDMIDAHDGLVSKEEEQELIQVFKRAMAYERGVVLHEYTNCDCFE